MGLKYVYALLIAAFFCTAQSQTTDLELGVKGDLDGPKAPYAIARFNYRVGPQVLGQDAYAVAESGAMLTSTPSLWFAGEILLDGEFSTEFVRLEYTEAGGVFIKTGIRFGF